MSVTQTIPITYLNPKLLVVGQDLPSITVVVSLSRPLLRASDLQSSVFLCIQLEDVRPVPEEWSLKDGNEKDPQSNLYTYCASIKLPGVTEEPKVLFISGGTLCMLEDSSPADLVQNLPRTISIIDEKSESKNEGCKNPSLKQPTDKLHEGKGIKWNTINHFWLGPTVLNKIRSEPDKKLELEVNKILKKSFLECRRPNSRDSLMQLAKDAGRKL